VADIPTPPKPPGPAAVHGAIKGKVKSLPKWAWIAGAFVLVGVAWMTYKKSTSAAAPLADDAMADPMTDVQDQLFPGPTQGAFAGGDVPPLDGGGTVDGGDGLGQALSLLDFLDQRDERRLSMLPGPESLSDSVIPAAAVTAAAVTGGGPPGRTVTNHLGPPSPVVKNGKFYHVYNRGKKNEKWVYVRPAAKTAPAAAHPAPKAPAGTPRQPAPAPAARAQSTVPRNIVKNGKFYHVYNMGTSSERWVYVRKAA
jgi:hypothetical protein